MYFICFLFFCAEEAEKDYWEKINADRVATYNSKREKKRGTEKVHLQTNLMKNTEIAVRNERNVILNVYDSDSKKTLKTKRLSKNLARRFGRKSSAFVVLKSSAFRRYLSFFKPTKAEDFRPKRLAKFLINVLFLTCFTSQSHTHFRLHYAVFFFFILSLVFSHTVTNYGPYAKWLTF